MKLLNIIEHCLFHGIIGCLSQLCTGILLVFYRLLNSASNLVTPVNSQIITHVQVCLILNCKGISRPCLYIKFETTGLTVMTANISVWQWPCPRWASHYHDLGTVSLSGLMPLRPQSEFRSDDSYDNESNIHINNT